jgi:cytochrome c oxidase subunit 1
MGISATFALLAALFFWFPKMFGRQLNESLGKLHFGLSFAGVCLVFLPMHWIGLASQAGGLSARSLSSAHLIIQIGLLFTLAVQSLFFLNLFWTLARGARVTERNPWRSTTLEWILPSPPPVDGFGEAAPVVYRGAYEFRSAGESMDFLPQHLAPGDVAAKG